MDWFKIKYGGGVGYVSKNFANASKQINSITNYSRLDDNTSLFYLILFSGLGSFFAFFYFLNSMDQKRMLIEIHYEIDDKVKGLYDKFLSHFKEVMSCSSIWQYLDAQNTYDYKYTSGASQTINRINIMHISEDRKPARFFKTNIEIPNIKLKNTDLFFFPERLIIKRGREFASVFYKNMEVDAQTIRFIEEGSVPRDAKVVDQTWRYLNKNGTPDRRFNNNRQIPICLYSTYTISSGTGIYEKISTSKIGAFDNFANFLKAIGNLQRQIKIKDISPRQDNDCDRQKGANNPR